LTPKEMSPKDGTPNTDWFRGSPAAIEWIFKELWRSQGGNEMSTQIAWGPRVLPATEASSRNEVVLDNRLSALREVALTLLREVESLRITEPVNLSRKVRLSDEVQRFEVDLICSALSRTAGNQTRAARLLGVNLTTLNSKIKRYKIPVDGRKSDLESSEDQESVA
jgi:Bacterial regulatory protein, Fis family